jgi:hypothetical protein
MKNKNLLQRFFPHLIVLFVFILITFLYFSPLLEGKTLTQHDIIQAKGAAKELNDYREKSGRLPLWTNSMFGGMPAYMIGADYPNSWTSSVARTFVSVLPDPANLVVLYLIGFYILLLALNFNPWLAAVGSIAYAFCSYNLINIEAGHASKVIAMGYLPPILAGVILAFRGRYWIGGALTGLFLALHLYGNHVQITYYLFITLALYGLFELVFAIREKRLQSFGIAAAVLVVAVGLAFGSHASRLLTTNEYSKESTRGKTELTQGSQNAKGGLDRDYAFNWSYGKAETFTLLVPNFYSGATVGELNPSSNTYQALIANNVPQNQAREFIARVPLYWGDQPFTGGPAYAGAIVCFLFVLAMFIVKDRIKWWLLATSIILISFAWGKNFFLNDLLFDYFPFFNKFRAVTMTLTLVQVYLCLGAALAVKELVQEQWTWDRFKKPLLYSLAFTAGVAFLLGLLGGVIFDYSSVTDTQQQLPPWLVNALRDDRQSMQRMDAFRSVFFILAAAGLIILYLRKKLAVNILYLGLGVLILIDLFNVDKRYFNNDDFVSKRKADDALQMMQADAVIKQDTTQYRVIDLTKGLGVLGDARASYFHHSIGGYHGAKMQRYAELFDSVVFKELTLLATSFQQQKFSPQTFSQLPALNMLNTKYFILSPEAQGVVENPAALGNAWFVQDYKVVPNANAEIKALQGNFQPSQTAIVDQRYANELKGVTLQPDSAASIRLISYSPEKLAYQSSASGPQLAVFSEIYYHNQDYWQAFVDGKPVPSFRADYVLRAMMVPAGSHKIEFVFEGNTYKQGETIALISSILLFAFVAAAIFMNVRENKRLHEEVL